MPSHLSLGYRRGTLILTDRGECAIEALRVHDHVMTAAGVARPVRWISQRSYSGQFAAGNHGVLPIVIRANALQEGVPQRDLWVSPQHALSVDDRLIPARALLNGVSIQQPESVEEVSYYHLELDQHDVIVADGAPAESCIDDHDAGRDGSASARSDPAEAWEAIRKRLAARAGAPPVRKAGQSGCRGQLDAVDWDGLTGWAIDDDQPDRPVKLRILDNGAPIGEVLADQYREDLQAAGIGHGRHAFTLAVAGGFERERRHLIEVQRVDDAVPLPGSPYILEAAPVTSAVMRNALPAAWSGSLDLVTRDRVEGWAFQKETPGTPLALVILSNGQPIARVVANRYRDDLESAGIGDGRHGFAVTIPGGLSPLTRQVVQVLGEADGCEIPGSPVTIGAAAGFDASLEHAISAAVSALALPADRDRVLRFLAAQTEKLLQASADAAVGREARLIRQRYERRWGKAESPSAPSAPPATARRALVIDDLVPVPDRDAGSIAILSHMRALQALGYDVSFVAAEELTPADSVVAALEAQNFTCCRAPYYVSVEEVLRRQRDGFEVIYLHRMSNATKYLTLARRYSPKARILYSVADLHHMRVARQAKVEGRPELVAISQRMRMAEFLSASSANAVITHSSVEAAWLRQSIKGCNVHVVPWAVMPRPTNRPWNERRGVALIANFGHTPNIDAAHFLVSQIMPRVLREDPAIECLLIGSNMPESIKRIAAPGIVVVGYVPDLSALYGRVRLTVAPLRYGAGVKGKVLESLAAGVPCVMSAMAAEGIALSGPLASTVCGDAHAMAASILRLHADEAEFHALAEAGLTFIAANYGEDQVRAGLQAAIEGQRAPSAAAVPPSKTGAATT